MQALEQVIFRKRQGQHQEAQSLIEQALNELLHTSARDFSELSLEETLSAISRNGAFNAELGLSVAELLYEQDAKASAKSKLQALLLYRKAMEDPAVAIPLQALDKITGLEEDLAPDELAVIRRLLDQGAGNSLD